MRSVYGLLCLAAMVVAGNTGCCGCYRSYGATYAAPAYPAPAYPATPPVVYQPPTVVQGTPATCGPACSQCAPACGCQ